MSRPLYTVLFGSIVAPGAGSHLVYTVPAGKLAVVRDICLTNVSAGALHASLSGSDGVPLYDNFAIPANSVDRWTGRQVLNAGDTLLLQTTAGPVGLRVSGYLLSV